MAIPRRKITTETTVTTEEYSETSFPYLENGGQSPNRANDDTATRRPIPGTEGGVTEGDQDDSGHTPVASPFGRTNADLVSEAIYNPQLFVIGIPLLVVCVFIVSGHFSKNFELNQLKAPGAITLAIYAIWGSYFVIQWVWRFFFPNK